MPKFLPFLLLFLIYIAGIFLPSTSDAWYYAACVKQGENLFLSHHLLYNAFAWLWSKMLPVEVLYSLKVMNSLAAIATLFVFSRLLSLLQTPDKQKSFSILFLGSCFGFLRFAIENETYILPLFFAITGVFYYLKSREDILSKDFDSAQSPFVVAERSRSDKLSKIRYLLLSGLSLSLACLFHQLYIWTCLGLFVAILLFESTNRWKKLLLFSAPFAFVPLVYALVYAQQTANFSLAGLWQFVLHDFYAGQVESHFSYKHILLGAINLFRTFFQVNGYMLVLIRENFLWILPALPLFVFVFSLLRKYKKESFHFSFPVFSSLQKTFALLFLLHFAFAIYAVGNAEFMTMLPFFLLLFLQPYFLHFEVKKWAWVLLIWNVGYGVFAPYFLEKLPVAEAVDWIQKHPQDLIISNERALLEARLYYESGQENHPNLWHTPENLVWKGRTPQSLYSAIDSTQRAGNKCWKIEFPSSLNRAAFVIDSLEKPELKEQKALNWGKTEVYELQ